MVRSTGYSGDGNVAVEVEIATKKLRDYERIFRWYRRELPYPMVAWFCASPAVEQKLAALVARERLDDLMRVLRLPNAAPGCP